MRRMAWSRAMLGLVVIAGAFAITMPPALAQMCSAAIKDCERQADAEAQRCTFQCQRYDTICADRCDDNHDTFVRYCWIRQALCKSSAASESPVKSSSEHK